MKTTSARGIMAACQQPAQACPWRRTTSAWHGEHRHVQAWHTLRGALPPPTPARCELLLPLQREA